MNAALEQQPALFSLAAITDKAEQRELTGEGIRQRNPALYDAVVKMGKAGFSCRMAAELAGISKNTAAQIFLAGVGTGERNQLLADRASKCALLILDALAEKLETSSGNLKMAELSVGLGIIATHLPQLQGGPSMTVRVEHTAPQFSGMLEEIRQKMGLAGGAVEQRARGDRAELVVDAEAIAPAGDMESPAIVSLDRDGRSDDTAFVSRSTESTPSKQGGAGVVAALDGDGLAMDSRISKTQQTP
jgi:hypothetical protein